MRERGGVSPPKSAMEMQKGKGAAAATTGGGGGGGGGKLLIYTSLDAKDELEEVGVGWRVKGGQLGWGAVVL